MCRALHPSIPSRYQFRRPQAPVSQRLDFRHRTSPRLPICPTQEAQSTQPLIFLRLRRLPHHHTLVPLFFSTLLVAFHMLRSSPCFDL